MEYQSKFKDAFVDELFEAILKLENQEECYRFFEDIATIAEIQALAQRLKVAKMLRLQYTYAAIAGETGASTATISRVKRCLHYGADGYNLVLRRLEASEGGTVKND